MTQCKAQKEESGSFIKQAEESTRRIDSTVGETCESGRLGEGRTSGSGLPTETHKRPEKGKCFRLRQCNLNTHKPKPIRASLRHDHETSEHSNPRDLLYLQFLYVYPILVTRASKSPVLAGCHLPLLLKMEDVKVMNPHSKHDG